MSTYKPHYAEIFEIDDPFAFLARVGELTRAISGGDGSTFVLRDGDYCYYAEENAIAPLWKGKRFHARICISGWAMVNKMSAVIEDIYLDMRIPLDAYKPTFVKSLAMVPVGRDAPVAALGSYWAQRHTPSDGTMQNLWHLADDVGEALAHAPLLTALRRQAAAAA